MTISTTTPINTYTGNSSTTVFAYNFRVLETADLSVFFDGVKQTAGFTVSGAGASNGGDVTFAVAPPTGTIVRLERITSLSRDTDYVEGGGLPSNTLDNDFDRLQSQIQEIDRRTIQEVSDATIDVENRVLKNVADPVNTQDVVTKNWAETVGNGFAGNAAASASAASASETNAAASASAASASETNAAASEAATNADVVSTNADVVSTNADVVTTNADVVTTNADVVTTNADVVTTNADVLLTNADVLLTNADVVSTNADVVSTNADVVSANTSASNALASELKSSKWSDEAWGVAVETGRYSAKHWATEAQNTVTQAIVYRGTWDASSGVYPSNPVTGDYYKVVVAGTTNSVVYAVGDGILYNDAASWDKVDNTESVSSVAGKVGAVTLVEADITDFGSYVKVGGDAMTGDLTVGSTTASNKLTLANPGIGNSSTINFAKTSDAARIIVTEVANDQTEFQFFLSDNPSTTVDKFNWFFQSWRGQGANWKPLEFSGYSAVLQSENITLRGQLNVGNTSYISTNGIYNNIATNLTGTITATFDVSANSSTSAQQYYLVLTTDGTTFSAYDRNGGTAYLTDIAITGTTQTIANGVTVTFSATTGGVAGDNWVLGVWPDGGLTSTSNIKVDNTAPTAIDHLTRKDYVDTKFSNKNVIINGNFDIWQRGTSQTASGYGSDDRWRNDVNVSTQAKTQELFLLGQTDVPNNPTFYSRVVVTSVADIAAYAKKLQAIESVTTFAGETATLSFWARTDVNKNMAVEFTQNFGTGGTPSTPITAIGVTTVPLTTAWTKYTYTVNIPSISGKTLGTDGNDTLGLHFWFEAGSNNDARTNALGQQSGTFDIAQVKLEGGSVATPFEPKSVAEELQACQRYYYRSATFNLYLMGRYLQGGGAGYNMYTFPVQMRAVPTFSSADGGTWNAASGYSGDLLAQTLTDSSVTLQTTATLLANDNVYASGGKISLDAEL